MTDSEDGCGSFCFFSGGGGLSLSEPELVPEPDAVALVVEAVASFSVLHAFLLR